MNLARRSGRHLMRFSVIEDALPMPEEIAPIVETYIACKSNDPTLLMSKFVVAYPHLEQELHTLLSALAAQDNFEGDNDAFELHRAPKGFEAVGELGRGVRSTAGAHETSRGSKANVCFA